MPAMKPHTLPLIALLGAVASAPPTLAAPAPIVRYDLTYAEDWAKDPARLRDAWDHVHAVAALQGIVNRSRPALFLRAVRHPESGNIRLDDWWLERLRADGAWLADRPVEDAPDIDALIWRYRAFIKGVVVYDESVPATSNVASTVAGVNDFLPVRYDRRPGSLFRRLTEDLGLPAKAWLIHPNGRPLFTGTGRIPHTGEESSGSAKNDAYRWAIARFIETGRCGSEALGYYIDAAWLKKPKASTFWNHTLTNHDYFIARRAFFFDLSPWDDEPATDDPGQKPGTDLVTMKRILMAVARRNGSARLAHVGGFTPWAFKYTDFAGGKHDAVGTEWKTVEIFSAHNAYLDADALSLCAFANASFFTHQPLPAYPPERARVRPPVGPVAAKHHVAFYAGDWDSAAWLYHMLPTLWTDTRRGEAPIGWAFNPNLSMRFPAAFALTRATRTPNDWFITGDSGAGYVNPSLLEAPRPSGLPSAVGLWERHNREWYARFGLSLTGFIIDGFAPPMPRSVLDAYARFSPDGAVAQKVEPVGVHRGMPLLRMSDDLPHDPREAARLILSRLDGDGPSFRIFRAILKSPSWYAEVAQAVAAGNPKADIVDPYTLMALVRRAQEPGDNGNLGTPDGATASEGM